MHKVNFVVIRIEEILIHGLEVKVYPNPTSEFLIIEVSQQENEYLVYELSDITGRKIVLKEM